MVACSAALHAAVGDALNVAGDGAQDGGGIDVLLLEARRQASAMRSMALAAAAVVAAFRRAARAVQRRTLFGREHRDQCAHDLDARRVHCSAPGLRPA